MSLKTTFKISLIITFLFSSFNSSAQNPSDEWIALQLTVFDQLNNKEFNPFYKGEIQLKNGNSLTGKVSLNYAENKEYETVIRQQDSLKFIPNKEIEDVVLYSEEGSKTNFSALDQKGLLYRKVYQNKNELTVYDSANRPYNNKLIATIFVKENDFIVNTFDFWTSGPKKDLVNYLNKRDGTNYKNRDFKTLEDLFEKL